MERQTGMVRMVKRDAGYGFIEGDDRAVYFFHRARCVPGTWEKLESGDRVEFDPVPPEDRGRPRGMNVRRLEG